MFQSTSSERGRKLGREKSKLELWTIIGIVPWDKSTISRSGVKWSVLTMAKIASPTSWRKNKHVTPDCNYFFSQNTLCEIGLIWDLFRDWLSLVSNSIIQMAYDNYWVSSPCGKELEHLFGSRKVHGLLAYRKKNDGTFNSQKEHAFLLGMRRSEPGRKFFPWFDCAEIIPSLIGMDIVLWPRLATTITAWLSFVLRKLNRIITFDSSVPWITSFTIRGR